MTERAAELKTSKSRGGGAKKAEADAKDCLDKIAEKLHAIVSRTTPDLAPKTWYGMSAYARDGKVIVFVKDASKFKMRYSEVGFNEEANLDDGVMWPTAFAAGERE